MQGDQQGDRLGNHPGADRELAATKPQHEQRQQGCERRRGDGGKDHGEVGLNALLGDEDCPVGAETDEGLLADRDQAGVTGEGVPHRGKDE